MEILDLFKKYCKIAIKYKNPIWTILKSLLLRFKLPYGFIDGSKIEKVMNKACSAKNIQNINQIKMPLSIQAVDITDGTLVRFISQGFEKRHFDEKIKYITDCSISKAVRASSSYPIVFNLCNIKELYLVDGGLRDNIPVDVLKYMGIKEVIASTFEEEAYKEVPEDLIEIASKCINIMGFQMSNEDLKMADYIIKTKLNCIKLLDIDKIDFCYEEGYKRGKELVKKLK